MAAKWWSRVLVSGCLGESSGPLSVVQGPAAEVCRAPVTKDHRRGGSNNRHLFSHSSGGWKAKIKVSAGLGSPWLAMPPSYCVLSHLLKALLQI